MTTNFQIIHHTICRRYIELFKNCPSVRTYVPKSIERVTRNDHHGQVTLLPYFFRASLAAEQAEKIPDEMVITLGVANLAGWVAYRIFDDALDGGGRPELLPLATMSLRHSVALYMSVIPPELHLLFHSLMNAMDEANSWERAATYRPHQLPDYKKYAALGYKSLPQCCGPFAILATLGYTTTDRELTKCISFFYHHLIARQLSDDALDWKKDLGNGFVNSVATQILKKLDRPWNIHDDMPELISIFQTSVKPDIITLINRRIHHAEDFLNHNPVIKYKEYLQSLVDSLKI